MLLITLQAAPILIETPNSLSRTDADPLKQLAELLRAAKEQRLAQT